MSMYFQPERTEVHYVSILFLTQHVILFIWPSNLRYPVLKMKECVKAQHPKVLKMYSWLQ